MCTHIHTQAGSQIDKQTDTHRHTGSQTDKQTDTDTHTHTVMREQLPMKIILDDCVTLALAVTMANH